MSRLSITRRLVLGFLVVVLAMAGLTTVGVVRAITEVGSVTEQINAHQATIAAAAEEQTATTQEMTRSAASAAEGSAQIAATIDGVASATRATSTSVAEARSATVERGEVSVRLQSLVRGFRF